MSALALATSITQPSTVTGLRDSGATGAAMIRALSRPPAKPQAPNASSAARIASTRLRPHTWAATAAATASAAMPTKAGAQGSRGRAK